MLSFREYVQLLEGILDDAKFDGNEYSGRYSHKKEIDGHHVHVMYTPHSSKTGKPEDNPHYHVDFTVNGSFLDHHGPTRPDTKHKVATFVKASVKHFIKVAKPESLTAKGTSSNKTTLYGKYFDHMAKKASAVTTTQKGQYGDTEHSIHFFY